MNAHDSLPRRRRVKRQSPTNSTQSASSSASASRTTVLTVPVSSSTGFATRTLTSGDPAFSSFLTSIATANATASGATQAFTTVASGAGAQTIVIVVSYATPSTTSSAPSPLNSTTVLPSSTSNSSSVRSSSASSSALSSSLLPTSDNSSSSSSSNDGGLSNGAIAGIAVSSVIGGLALLALLGYWLWNRRRGRDEDEALSMMAPSGPSALAGSYGGSGYGYDDFDSGAGPMMAESRGRY